MAEEFVIRIDTGRGTAGRGTETRTDSASLVGAGLAARQFGEMRRGAGMGPSQFLYQERLNREGMEITQREMGIGLDSNKLTNRGTMREFKWSDGSITQQQTLFGYGIERTSKFVSDNQRALKGGAAAFGVKAVQSQMQYRAYTSGDQYQNQKDSNNMRLAGYGTMLAMAGPKAPLVAAGIAVNEGFNAFNDYRQYNFDRAMDTIQINNTQAVAGDISYGRRNGVR